MSDHTPILLVHGGAWNIPDDMVEAHRTGIRNALAAGWKVLSAGGSSLDAVEEAVVVMEDDDTFDAGRGSFLTRDGHVQMDAMIMDGATLRAGGVGCVERVRNAVRAARLVLEKSPHVYFVAEGAEKFVEELGITLIDNSELVIPREVERLKKVQALAAKGIPDPTFAPAEFGSDMSSHDTVGAVALDANGRLAAATSTGGTVNKTPGRVGDSSLIGCGVYADDSAAASCTGWGEPIMKLVLAKAAADKVIRGQSPQQSAKQCIDLMLSKLNGRGGMILMDSRGKIGIAYSTPRMAWGWKSATGEEFGVER